MGAIASVLVWRGSGLGAGARTIQVLVAAGDIAPGVPILGSQVRMLDWPAASRPPGAFSDAKEVVGRIARQPMASGEPILASRLAPPRSAGGLSAMLPNGKRAISVRVDDVIGVAGFALPGGFVDVLVSVKDAATTPFSKIVIERVKVLAVEQETAADPTKPKVVSAVTLELAPHAVEKLDLARSLGTLSLVLRNEFDNSPNTSGGARLGDIFGGPIPAPAASVRTTPAPASPAARSAPTPETVQRRTQKAEATPPNEQGPRFSGVEEIRGTGNGGGER